MPAPMPEPRDEPRMSDLEALMWTIEKDPRLSASIANVTVLDQPPDRERLEARMALAAQAIPRLRQRVVPGLARLAPPEWRDDPDFDLGRHLRWRGLPAPGSRRQLLDLACDIVQAPFDRTRPLWEFVVVEGLDDGRAAMVQKLHHAVTDGVGGVRMSAQFLDIERDATEPLVAAHPVTSSPAPNGLADALVTSLGHDLRRGLGIARRAGEQAVTLARHPSRIAGLVDDSLAMVRSAGRQLTVGGDGGSPLWRERTTQRHLEVLSVPFDPAKRAAERLGGSLNDLFVTAAAGAAGAYHRASDTPIDELLMAMPISTRSDRSVAGNAFSPTRLRVPAGIDDPKERFNEIHRRLTTTRAEPAVSAVAGMAGVANLLPTSVLARLALAQTRVVDFTTSNVRGANFDLFVAGARIDENYPIGPLAGTAWNLTLLSYAGSLGFGLLIDRGAVAEPALLRTCVEDAFAELIETA